MVFRLPLSQFISIIHKIKKDIFCKKDNSHYNQSSYSHCMLINTELAETRNVLPMRWQVLNPSFELYRISSGPHQRRSARRNVDNMAAEKLLMIGPAL